MECVERVITYYLPRPTITLSLSCQVQWQRGHRHQVRWKFAVLPAVPDTQGFHIRRYPSRLQAPQSVNSHGSSKKEKNEGHSMISAVPASFQRVPPLPVNYLPPLPSTLYPFFSPSPPSSHISLSVAGKPASSRASKSSQDSEPFDVLSASLSPDVYTPPSLCVYRLIYGRLFLSSSASPYFVLLLVISFAFAHRPW